MAFVHVVAYSLACKAGSAEALVELKLADGNKVGFKTPLSNLAGYAAILNESPVGYDPDTRVLRTGTEPIGDI